MATYSSILAWRITWTEDPGGLQSMSSQRIRHNWMRNWTERIYQNTYTGFPGGTVVKNLLANAGDTRDTGFHPWVRKVSWSRKWQLTPVFLPGKFHAQRILVGYSPWGLKELVGHDWVHTYTLFFFFLEKWLLHLDWSHCILHRVRLQYHQHIIAPEGKATTNMYSSFNPTLRA